MGDNIKILGKKNIFCSICEEEHEVELIEKNKKCIIKGESVEYKEKFYRCTKYKEENTFQTSELWNEGLIRSLDAYRKNNNLLTSKEIKEIRKKYGITQLEFARLLNLGDITITRYETKQIQDISIDNMIKEVNDNSIFALNLLNKNKDKFEETRYLEIENNIKNVIDRNIIPYLNEQELIGKYIKFDVETIENGYSILNIQKLKNIVGYIVKKLGNVKKVVLMKLLWYSDSVSFKRNEKSMTGLVYIHMPYGALPIGHEEIIKLSSVKSEIHINQNEYEEYRITYNNEYKISNITKDEKEILDEVIEKFGKYKSSEIANYMHKEKAYKETKEKEIISFDLTKELREF